MVEKTILLIGRSGRGKSTLANVLLNKNDNFEEVFKESSSSVSETKKIQSEGFEFNPEKGKLSNLLDKLHKEEKTISEQSSLDKEDLKVLQKMLQENIQKLEKETAKYLIIDTPGIGDTKMSDSEVLDIIAGAIYQVRNGLSQVLFVIDSRFDKYEMATYNLLRTIIFDDDITKHTTIVRTNFANFRKKERCQEDINSMRETAQGKKAELEKKIADKEEERDKLEEEKASHNSEEYKKVVAEIENLNKELKSTLSEIIESCQDKVIHVDNPPSSKKLRKNSRKKALEYLQKTCQENYNPDKLKNLSSEIADDYFQYLQKKEELQQQLESERLRPKQSQTTINQLSVIQSSGDVPEKDKQTKLVAEKEEALTENKEKLVVIGVKEVIAQLQDRKERLKKEIAEKEKKIRQKVLKHIFNNYQEIKQELGGNVLLNSVAGDHNWQEIHSTFSEELAVKWLSQGFNYQQTKEWAAVLSDFDPKIDADFCVWLRDDKELTVKKIKSSSYPQNIGRLRNEYTGYLKKEAEILEQHNQQLDLEENDWADIHPDFAKKNWEDKTYQQYWEELGLTYQDAQEWILVGFKSDDYYQVKQWKNHNFTPQWTKSWTNAGLNKEDWEFADYLRENNYTPTATFRVKSYAQHWLDWQYPKEQRKETKKLGVYKKNLTGTLDLSDFVNLEELNCGYNKLTYLKVDKCLKLRMLDCRNNYLQELKLPSQGEQLTELYMQSNNFPKQDLSIFSKFVNLKLLWIHNYDQDKINQGIYNRFVGSLESLKNLTKLRELAIRNIDVDSGLEYLPDSIEIFYCSADKREAKCRYIYDLFVNEQGVVEAERGKIKNFPQKLQEYKQKLAQQQAQIVQNQPFMD